MIPAPCDQRRASCWTQRPYPSLERLGELALGLRGALVGAQEKLLALKTRYERDADYIALHQAIRAYIALQLEDEAKLIAPAFLGQGPRR